MAQTRETSETGRTAARSFIPALKATLTILGSFAGGALIVCLIAVALGIWPNSTTSESKIVTPSKTTTSQTSPADTSTTKTNDTTSNPGTSTNTIVRDPNKVEKVGNNTFQGTSVEGRGEACRAFVDAFSGGQPSAGQMSKAASLTSDTKLADLIAVVGSHLKQGGITGNDVNAVTDYCNSLGIAY